MELDGFLESYFDLLIKKLAAHGYNAETATNGMWESLFAMLNNDGSRTNEEAFWDRFSQEVGKDARSDMGIFLDFYENEFHGTKAACGFDPKAVQTLAAVKARGLRVVLATNPLFPMVGQKSRMGWVGLKPEDFDLVTSYETDRYCKPNSAYFRDVCRRIGVEPEQCVMIGNDEMEDMAAATAAGIPACFLVTDCRIAGEAGWDGPQGTFAEMVEWLRAL